MSINHVIASAYIVYICLSAASLSPAIAEENECEQFCSPKQIEKLIFPNKKGFRFKTDPPPSLALPAIQFNYNSYQLTTQARGQVKALATALKSGKLLWSQISVQGHTDSRGSEEYNRVLSQRRADSVVWQLVNAGIPSHRLVAVGFGETDLLPGVPNEDSRQRRVEIVYRGDVGHKRRALLIGINDYEQVDPLPSPVNDAEAMKSFISDRMGYSESDIRMLLNAQATRANIAKEFKEWLIGETNEGDEVFFFFSGHGYYQPDEDGDEADGKDETLIPVDSKIIKIDAEHSQITQVITDDEMAKWMKDLSGRQVQVVIDACHSGTIGKLGTFREQRRYIKWPTYGDGKTIRLPISKKRGSQVSSQFVEVPTSNTPLAVWTAVSADQKALVDRIPRQDGTLLSVFTRRLLWGVRDRKADEDGDGMVTRSELQEYVRNQSNAYCERNVEDCPANMGLTPQFVGSLGTNEPAFKLASNPQQTMKKDVLVRQARNFANRSNEETLDLKVGFSGVGESERVYGKIPRKFSIGSAVAVEVKSRMDGYVVMLDILPSGDMAQLIPAKPIQKNVPMSLMGMVEPPLGTGMLIAVFLEADNPHVDSLTSLVSRYKDVIPRPNAFLVEMENLIRRKIRGDDQEPHVTTFEYEVVSG